MFDRPARPQAGLSLVVATACSLALSVLSVTPCAAQAESEDSTRPAVVGEADPEDRAKGPELLGITEEEAKT
jgi:hypothetical protein